ncbi:5'-nucleotidase [Burkholderia cepacia]|uniref:5'-nucleotidase n=1 Tax=Burkholderia cepacia TaxID=292 RepID=UPI001F203B43|nr:5'-nucleotidase [Burkholderia cepacia]MCE4129866.1 5'-nucleotidase [Burkholderia cepacia]MDN7856298.1 5'-nucleotidase [Burkholderia cepacia]
MFLGGLPKVPFLVESRPDIFFDLHVRNCKPASRQITTGHVPYGINKESYSGPHQRLPRLNRAPGRPSLV